MKKILICYKIITRFRKFRRKNVLYGMVITPLVLPDVVLGISLLLMFTSLQNILGWPSGRGLLTIVIAHITFCSAYVAIMMQARIVSVDRTIEEAAMDLGARPAKTFFYIALVFFFVSLAKSALKMFVRSSEVPVY